MGYGAARTMGVVLDEEGVCPGLLPLLRQMHEAPAERSQGPSEAHRGEELEQVRPENLGERKAWSASTQREVPCREGPARALRWRQTLCWACTPWATALESSAVARQGRVPCTHVTHPVHGGADQVEGAHADGPHTVGPGVLAAGAWLLRLEEGKR